MLTISFKPSFVRQFNRLSRQLQDEVLEKIAMLKDRANHAKLRVHKLRGPLRGCHSFSIDFKHRVLFEYASPNEAVLLVIGDHEIYD